MITTTKPFSLIVACTHNGGIGKDNGIPWHVPQDMKHFYRVTTGTRGTNMSAMNAVIMGRKTWESMQQKRLKNRINVVISGSQTLTDEYAKSNDIILAQSLQDALDKLGEIDNVGDVVVGDVFVIGGASVYQDALCHPMCTTAHVTWIHGHYDCDTFFPVEALARTFEKDGTGTCLCVEETPVYSIVKYERRDQNLYNGQP